MKTKFIYLVLTGLALACFALSPTALAVTPALDGGYPNQNTPASWIWRAAASLNTARYSHTATLLQNGMVLVAGGFDNIALASAELYESASGSWAATRSLNTARGSHTATLLQNRKVLVAGGFDINGRVLARVELGGRHR